MSRFQTLFLIGFAALGMSFLEARAQGKEQDKEHGWKLTQNSQMIGNQLLWITPKSLKVVHKTTGVTTITQAPDWKVYVVNDARKQYFETPFEKLDEPANIRTFLPFRLDMAEANWQEVRNLSLKGIPAHELSFERATSPKLRAKGKSGLFLSTSLGSGTYICSRGIEVPKPEQTVLSKLYLTPCLPGIPLDFIFSSLLGGSRSPLTTINAEPYTYNAKDFALPSNYTKVASGTVFVGTKGDDFGGMADFLNEMGSSHK